MLLRSLAFLIAAPTRAVAAQNPELIQKLAAQLAAIRGADVGQ